MNKHCALPPTLEDQRDRDQIYSALDRNLLVEAAAGTGKTTCMVGRMAALLSAGCCTINTLAAVTFTRKAAAQLRERFQTALAQAAAHARGPHHTQLEKARARVEQCFIGTIHAFCGRLLRERPVEAGISPDFEELDENQDYQLRIRAWSEYAARLFAHDPDGRLAQLNQRGLQLSQLEKGFLEFCNYPDVAGWPRAEAPLVRVASAGKALQTYLEYLRAVLAAMPADPKSGSLLSENRRAVRMARHHDLNDPAQLIQVLGLFRKDDPPSMNRELMRCVEKSKQDELRRKWREFSLDYAMPALEEWRRHCYQPVIDVYEEARSFYDQLRQTRHQLNYQDLLMKAAALLKTYPKVRAYFHQRFTHLLVDEFQDTDPIQAEVLLLLTATDERETDWRKCRPHPGALFVVGDPKQSIYRFRRADIVTYNTVKEIIHISGGQVLKLSANFRATPSIVHWVNQVFQPRFGQFEGTVSPAYVALQPSRCEGGAGKLCGVWVLRVNEEHSTRNDDAVAYDAEFIAKTIRRALDEKATVTRSHRELEAGIPPEAQPDDFLLITYNKKHLSLYAQKLQEYGIPHQVTGGSALNETRELRLLHLCLLALAQPDNPVVLVAALRSELFGFSDRALYAYKKAGGKFNWHEPAPSSCPQAERVLFEQAFAQLQRHADWLRRMSTAAAMGKIIADLGLVVLAAAGPGGDVQAGSIYKGLELLRQAQTHAWCLADLVDYLGRIVENVEPHDSLSARAQQPPAVRVMNLHKAKGLEAPVVFLANPTGKAKHEVALHISREAQTIRGYLAVSDKGRLLATPENWEAWQSQEEQFLAAERERLYYVAATRAESCLIISQREHKKNAQYNPWEVFYENLKEAPVMPDPSSGVLDLSPLVGERKKGGPSPDDHQTVAHLLSEFHTFASDLKCRREQVLSPTYEAQRAKEYSLSQSPAHVESGWMSSLEETGETPVMPPPEGEHGCEWGIVVHQLLQVAMTQAKPDFMVKAGEAGTKEKPPSADALKQLACGLLVEHGFGPERAAEALALVEAVYASPIWQRALASKRWLTETPFQYLMEKRDINVPTILRGAIDLVFQEEDGWVIVDYKTDRVTPASTAALVQKYAPQLALYAEAFQDLTGGKIKETGLYFTDISKYIQV